MTVLLCGEAPSGRRGTPHWARSAASGYAAAEPIRPCHHDVSSGIGSDGGYASVRAAVLTAAFFG
jgi:hypothetical protein